MRVVHVYKDYFPVLGGIENHVRLLAEREAARGLDVTVLVTARQGPTQVTHEGGVRVIRAARLATVASTPLSLALGRELGRLEADIAHLHFPYPVGEVSQLLCGRARRVVISYHSDVVRQKTLLRFYRPLMHRVLRRADRILVATPNYLATSSTLRQYGTKCTIVPYGIEQGRFSRTHRGDPEVRAIRERFSSGPLILFVGVLRYYKGLRYMLDAMVGLDARLAIVGAGPMEASLRAQCAELGLEDKVYFCGAVSDTDLPAYYAAADMFVLPACERSEAFGLVQVEALASGLPIVSTELGTGTSYVNQHAKSGLVVAPRDSDALRVGIAKLLGDEALRKRMAAGARERAKLFTAERMVSDVLQQYEQVLAGYAE